jgi:hypothetical protein
MYQWYSTHRPGAGVRGLNVTVYGKAKVARQIPEKKGKSKKKNHPQVQKYIQKWLKIAPMSLKLIVFQYNSFIQTSKIYKNHFFPSFPRPTFQNVITHKIFEIL